MQPALSHYHPDDNDLCHIDCDQKQLHHALATRCKLTVKRLVAGVYDACLTYLSPLGRRPGTDRKYRLETDRCD